MSMLCGPFPVPLIPDWPSTLNVTVVVTVKLFCDDSTLFCCDMGLMVGVVDQRGGGAGGVRMGTKFSVFGGVGRGALTKLLLCAALGRRAAIGLLASIADVPFLALATGDTKLFWALQLV